MQMDQWSSEGLIDPKNYSIMKNFLKSYWKTGLGGGAPQSQILKVFDEYLPLLGKLLKHPFKFEPYHQMITKPFDHYQFGLDFARPLVNQKASKYLGHTNLKKIHQRLLAKENVIFLANHQTEIDPQLISILIENEYPQLAQDMIFVAGDRVISDHLAIPISMGRNLLCIYSKKHINSPPEQMEKKRLHNKRTMQLMSELLAEGGKCIYVAPSGGRDRPDKNGEFQVAPFDPQSIEMFYLMTKKAGTITHFHPLALLTYRVLPPPNDVEVELGEERFTEFAGVYASFGKEIDMLNFSGQEHENKIHQRHARSEYIWNQVNDDYQRLKELRDQYDRQK